MASLFHLLTAWQPSLRYSDGVIHACMPCSALHSLSVRESDAKRVSASTLFRGILVHRSRRHWVYSRHLFEQRVSSHSRALHRHWITPFARRQCELLTQSYFAAAPRPEIKSVVSWTISLHACDVFYLYIQDFKIVPRKFCLLSLDLLISD